MENLTDFGQIKDGDKLLIRYRGKDREYKALAVLFEGQPLEEVVIDLERNKYFIVSMALDGTSWAKDVRIINNEDK